jgi:hypothetical protein
MSYVIPKQFYIGYQERVDRNWKLPIEDRVKVKLGFATYHEDNAKFETRKSTVDNWAQPYDLEYVEHDPDENHKHGWRERVQHLRDDLKSELLFNDPVTGFKLSDFVKRTGWNGGNVVWRIQDPRGFELEISSANMQQLLDYCVITKGVIESPCVYAWSMKGSKVCLIPTNSELYQEAELDTDRRQMPVIKMSQINVGDLVAFKTSKVAVYWGHLYNYKHFGEPTNYLQGSRKYLFQIVEMNPTDNSMITTNWEWLAGPKVVEIKGSTTEKFDNSADYINLKIRDHILFDMGRYPDVVWCTDFVSDQPVDVNKLEVTFELISPQFLNFNSVIKKDTRTNTFEYVRIDSVYEYGKHIRYGVIGGLDSLDTIKSLSQLSTPSRYLSYNNMKDIRDIENYEFYIPCVKIGNVNVPMSHICVAL